MIITMFAASVVAMFLTTKAVIKVCRKHMQFRAEEDEVDVFYIRQTHTENSTTF
jgi:hypothetical protein